MEEGSTMLIKLGFFDEIPTDEALSILQDFKNNGPLKNESKVIQYLQSGTELFIVAGLATDLLSKNNEVIGSLIVSSDGEWCWSSDIVYYINKYHIAIPSDFLSRMEKLDWQCPLVGNSKDLISENWQI
ncbi:MAG: hypothetical protein R3C11_27220 [Planctomycetaceae bacterium]